MAERAGKMIPTWEEIREMELRRDYCAAIAALETRLASSAGYGEEAVIRLGFNLWLAVVYAMERDEYGEPYAGYARRFVELLRKYEEQLHDNADFCWAFGQGIEMFWPEFPGTTREEGAALIKRAESLDSFWARFWTGGISREEREEKFRGRGVFEGYYGYR